MKMTKREIIETSIIVALWLVFFFTFPGCAYNGTATVNLSLINSRSPAVNGVGENMTEAATGFTGGGKLDANVPVSAVP